ncbi:MAG: phytoene/squalene synthase family protein, partial [Aureliella sp.]
SVGSPTTARLNHLEPESTELRASRRWCAHICRQSKSSFLASFALLDSARRQATCALYAFARITDDLGDNAAPAALRAAQLNQLRTQLWKHCDARTASPSFHSQLPNPDHLPVESYATNPPIIDDLSLDYTSLWPALSYCVERYQIPVQLLDDIITGVSMDVQHRQPADWNELRRYCHHVASAVGLACTHIWREAERTVDIPTQAACDCGFAFQLTNILRDIGEDALAGRIYIPQTLFDEYSVDRDAWLASQPSGNWQAMLEEIAERTSKLYSAGWPTIHVLSPRSRRMFSLIWHSYRELLPTLMTNKERLWTAQKLHLRKTRRLRMLTTHACAPLRMLIR